MKKNVRNALAISGLALAIGASGLTLTASAHGNRDTRIQRSHQERIIRSKKIKIEKIGHNRRFVAGFVTNTSDNSLTITSGSKTYIVNITTDTRILNRTWSKINLADIKIGNKVKISGAATDLVVTAKTIRNISLF